MEGHLFYTKIEGFNNEAAKLKDLAYYVEEGKEIDQHLKCLFPIESYGKLEESLAIKGSKQLLHEFDNIRGKKYDIVEELGGIEFVGFTDKDEIILYFKEDNFSAPGIYDFSNDFLDDLFHMAKYARFCIRNDEHDIVRENIKELFTKFKDTKKQYRILIKDEAPLLRAVTSTMYNNYDNHLALYIILLMLHKLSMDRGLYFAVNKAYLTDSAIKVFFKQEDPIAIEGVGDVHLGLILTNSEIKENKLSLEMRYMIVDSLNPNVFFGGIPDLKEAVFDIIHTSKVVNIKHKMDNVFNLETIQNTMLTFIKKISDITHISDDAIYKLYKYITESKTLRKESKKKLMELYDKEIINNTLTILQAFNKVSEIITDIDERIYLERIYHKLLTDLTR